jgi:hypothetical protein
MAKVYFYNRSGTITVIANAQGQPYYCERECPCNNNGDVVLFADTVSIVTSNDYTVKADNFPERN